MAGAGDYLQRLRRHAMPTPSLSRSHLSAIAHDPAANQAAPPPAADPPALLGVSGVPTGVVHINGVRRSSPIRINPPAPRPRLRLGTVSRRILIVDDNRDHVVSLAALLEAMGHEVRSVYDGGAALDAVANYRPHVVILDIGLPVIDGYEVARCLRSTYADRSLLLIAMTGYGQPRDSLQAKEAGFDSFMVKPPDIRALSAILNTGKRIGLGPR